MHGKLNILRTTVAKEAVIYTMTDMIGKGMSFIMLMVISYYLSPSELGIATNFTVLTQFIILLAGLAIVNSLPYFFYEQKHEENVLLVSNLLLLCTVLCLLLGGTILLFHKYIYNYLLLDTGVQCLSIFFVLGSLVSQINLTLLRLENKPKQFAVLQIIQIILHATFVILFVIGFNGGGLGKIFAEVLVFTFIGLLHLYFIIKKGYLIFHANKTYLKKLLRFGIPLLPHSISFWFKNGIDKIFITTYCGLQFNGLYSMAVNICALYTMLTHSFFNAYTPYLQKELSRINNQEGLLMVSKKRIVKHIYQLYFLFFIIGILAIIGARIIINYIIDSKYSLAFQYIPLMILAYFIYTFYSFTIQFIYKAKKTLIMGCITFTGSLIQMLLSYWLIRLYGVMGAVYSLLIGNSLITLGIFIYSNKVYKMPWFSFSLFKQESVQ